MAFITARLGAYIDEACIVTLRYNNANGAVQSVTVANNSGRTFAYRVWLRADPTQFSEGTVPAGQTQTFNVVGGIRYSPTEVPPGDPKETNFDYTAWVM